MSLDAEQRRAAERAPGCCPLYHEAVELIGRRWTGAIVAVLLDGGALRFSEIAQAVPDLSDRLLSERMKELEARGVVRRTAAAGPPPRVLYELTDMGRSLEPALCELRTWAQRWLDAGAAGGPIRRSASPPRPRARAARSTSRAS